MIKRFFHPNSVPSKPVHDARMAHWRAIVASQPQHSPPPQVYQRLVDVIAQSPQPAVRSLAYPSSLFLWGYLALTTAIFILLWLVLQPGIVLQWSVLSGGVSAYQIYRASLGEEEFTLIGEVSAHDKRQAYTYVDPWLLPGQTYTYRVQAIQSGGSVAYSNAIVTGAMQALPGQLALLTISLCLGFALLEALKGWFFARISPSWNSISLV